MPELHAFEYGGTTFGTFEKTFALNVEDIYVIRKGRGYKIMFLTTKYGKVGFFHVAD